MFTDTVFVYPVCLQKYRIEAGMVILELTYQENENLITIFYINVIRMYPVNLSPCPIYWHIS